jgi:uncharacterized protein YcsI (UPF0317 family)
MLNVAQDAQARADTISIRSMPNSSAKRSASVVSHWPQSHADRVAISAGGRIAGTQL